MHWNDVCKFSSQRSLSSQSVVIYLCPHQGLDHHCSCSFAESTASRYLRSRSLAGPGVSLSRGVHTWLLHSPDDDNPGPRWDSWPCGRVQGFAKDDTRVPYLDCFAKAGSWDRWASWVNMLQGPWVTGRISIVYLHAFGSLPPNTHPSHPHWLVIKQWHIVLAYDFQ